MSSTLKSTLLFLAALVLVLIASLLYSRSLRVGAPRPEAAPTPTEAPSDPALHPELAAGVEAIRAGDLQAARERLVRVPTDDPGRPLALQHLGRVLQGLGDHTASLAAWEALTELQPDLAEAHLEQARAAYLLGRLDEAELSTLRTIELAPSSLAARYEVAKIRLAAGRLGAAIRAYHRALAFDTTRAHLFTAYREVEHLAEQRPDLAEAHYALAFFANRTGQTEREIRELEAYLAAAAPGPGADTARNQLARARATAGS